MRRVVASALLLAASGGAVAVGSDVGPSIRTSNDRWAVWFGQQPPSSTRTYVPTTVGGVEVFDPIKGTLPSGRTVDLQAKRTFSPAAVRAGIKTVVKVGIPGLIISEVAPIIWDAIKDRAEPGPGGGIVVDPGEAQIMRGGKMNDFRTGTPMTPGAILAREAASICNGQGGGEANLSCTVTHATSGCQSGICHWTIGATVRYPNGTIAWTLPGGDTGPEIVAPGCPDWNFTSPRLIPVDPSKPCPTPDRRPPTDPEIDDIVNRVPPGLVGDFGPEVDKHPGGFPGDSTPPAISGPPSVDETPSVTTKPDGTTETTTKRWDIGYPGDGTVTFTPRIITTTPGGTTETTGGDPQDTRTDCEKNPQSLGCAEFGQPGQETVPKDSKPITFDPVSIGSDGACPADLSFQAGGSTYDIEFQPICDGVESYVRPLVLILGGALSLFVFVGGLKS